MCFRRRIPTGTTADRRALKELRKCFSSVTASWICADAVRGENLRFFPELRHRVAKMLRVLAYDSGGAALPELLRPGTLLPLMPFILSGLVPSGRGTLFPGCTPLKSTGNCRIKVMTLVSLHLEAGPWSCQQSALSGGQDSVSKGFLHVAGKDGCVPWLVNELGNLSTHWCTRAELAAVLGSLARIPALSAAMVRHQTLVYFPALATVLWEY